MCRKVTCKKCQAEKEISEFRGDSRQKNGILMVCKECRARLYYEEKEFAQRVVRRSRARAEMVGALSDITAKEVLEVKEAKKCAYCRCEITYKTGTVDHVLPLVGGFENTAGNLVHACRPCNSRKRNRNVYEFMVISDDEGRYGLEAFNAFCQIFVERNGGTDATAVSDSFITDYIAQGRTIERVFADG